MITTIVFCTLLAVVLIVFGCFIIGDHIEGLAIITIGLIFGTFAYHSLYNKGYGIGYEKGKSEEFLKTHQIDTIPISNKLSTESLKKVGTTIIINGDTIKTQ